MKYFEECIDIIALLEKDRMRCWGLHINQFISLFMTLTDCERLALINKTDSRTKFNLLSQLLGHICKEFDGADHNEKRRMISQYYILLIFENNDWDYRESILNTQSFAKATVGYRKIIEEERDKVSHLATEKTLSYFG